jgi:MinD superfamily P-loop ATPase
MITSIAGGKGGTGKTSVAVNLALAIKDVQLLDCDVEEPNVHLLLRPEVNETNPVYVMIPQIDKELCDYCGKCSEFCEYNALFVGSDQILVFPELCLGCGGCVLVCPKNAIAEERRRIGLVKTGTAGDVEVVYGELEVGEPMAVPIIKAVKKQIKNHDTTIIDSPPGTSCPVIESINQSNYVLLVTEPTPFGLHDLKMMVQVVEQLRLCKGVAVNRAGIGDKKLYAYCEEKEIPILLEIPFDRKIAELYSRGIPFTSQMPEWREKFQALFDEIKDRATR